MSKFEVISEQFEELTKFQNQDQNIQQSLNTFLPGPFQERFFYQFSLMEHKQTTPFKYFSITNQRFILSQEALDSDKLRKKHCNYSQISLDYVQKVKIEQRIWDIFGSQNSELNVHFRNLKELSNIEKRIELEDQKVKDFIKQESLTHFKFKFSTSLDDQSIKNIEFIISEQRLKIENNINEIPLKANLFENFDILTQEEKNELKLLVRLRRTEYNSSLIMLQNMRNFTDKTTSKNNLLLIQSNLDKLISNKDKKSTESHLNTSMHLSNRKSMRRDSNASNVSRNSNFTSRSQQKDINNDHNKIQANYSFNIKDNDNDEVDINRNEKNSNSNGINPDIQKQEFKKRMNCLEDLEIDNEKDVNMMDQKSPFDLFREEFPTDVDGDENIKYIKNDIRNDNNYHKEKDIKEIQIESHFDLYKKESAPIELKCNLVNRNISDQQSNEIKEKKKIKAQKRKEELALRLKLLGDYFVPNDFKDEKSKVKDIKSNQNQINESKPILGSIANNYNNENELNFNNLPTKISKNVSIKNNRNLTPDIGSIKINNDITKPDFDSFNCKETIPVKQSHKISKNNSNKHKNNLTPDIGSIKFKEVKTNNNKIEFTPNIGSKKLKNNGHHVESSYKNYKQELVNDILKSRKLTKQQENCIDIYQRKKFDKETPKPNIKKEKIRKSISDKYNQDIYLPTIKENYVNNTDKKAVKNCDKEQLKWFNNEISKSNSKSKLDIELDSYINKQEKKSQEKKQVYPSFYSKDS